MNPVASMTRLFEPGAIGTMQVRNRIVMPAIGTLSHDQEGNLTDRAIDYYVERAKGGVGLIISEAIPVLRETALPARAWLCDDRFIPRFRDLANAVHEHGAKMALQLQHIGKVLSKESHPGKDPQETVPIGPSAVPWVKNGVAPREATRDDIERIKGGFAEAARRAKDAGFDGVEIHGAHGYLISLFLSPFTNKRTDEYGGSVQTRARFACEILARVRQKVGPDFPVILRISACDYIEGGITLEDTLRQAPMFVESGADALHVSASAQETFEWMSPSHLWPSAPLVHLAEAVKRAVKVPVIAVGKLGEPLLAEEILRQGKTDFVAMGRPLLADPELPNKARAGRLDDIRRCIYCNNCLTSPPERRKPGGWCTVNPAVLREREFAIRPATSPKSVMVVGGGLAGMEAARVLAERGHQVALFEKSDKLGGQWDIACRQESKHHFATLTERLIRGLSKTGVKVVLNKEVTAQFVRETAPDAVIVATGSDPQTPDVPGSRGQNVVQANDVITGQAKAGKRVVVLGGGRLGMEVADWLAEQGKEVSLVTRRRLGGSARPVGDTVYRPLRDRMIDHGVRMYSNSPLLEIRENGVYVNDNQTLLFLKADTVVLAVGAKPVNHLVQELKGLVPEVHAVGDCVEPRDALAAVGDGAVIGRKV